MIWSKLKSNVEESFADCIKGRVRIYTTRYKKHSHFMVRGWITIDGEEIANFSTPENRNRFWWNIPPIDNRIPNDYRTEGHAVEYGEFTQYDLIDACWEYMHLNIDNALTNDNPIIKAFAVIDRRIGKRRLKVLRDMEHHPLVERMLQFRIECEYLSKSED